MAEQSDHDLILEFVELCRDEHVAPYPVALRIVQERTGLSMYRGRFVVDQLLEDGRLAKMPAYPDHGVVLP
jgi:hypothetical protein